MYYNERNNWKNRSMRKSPIKRIITKDRVIAREQRGVLGGIGGEVIFGRGRHIVEYTKNKNSISVKFELNKIGMDIDAESYVTSPKNVWYILH